MSFPFHLLTRTAWAVFTFANYVFLENETSLTIFGLAKTGVFILENGPHVYESRYGSEKNETAGKVRCRCCAAGAI